MFGTEELCLKYHLAWDPVREFRPSIGDSWKGMFPDILDMSCRTDEYRFSDDKTTPNLVSRLFEASDPM